jgi:septal ring factor EnvC (AmiA/AmiB activator)
MATCRACRDVGPTAMTDGLCRECWLEQEVARLTKLWKKAEKNYDDAAAYNRGFWEANVKLVAERDQLAEKLAKKDARIDRISRHLAQANTNLENREEDIARLTKKMERDEAMHNGAIDDRDNKIAGLESILDRLGNDIVDIAFAMGCESDSPLEIKEHGKHLRDALHRVLTCIDLELFMNEFRVTLEELSAVLELGGEAALDWVLKKVKGDA